MNIIEASPPVSSVCVRIGRALYPAKHVECPEPDDEVKGHGDVICVSTVTDLSIMDRLKILFSGRVAFDLRVATEHSVGNTKATAEAYPLPPKWMDSRK